MAPQNRILACSLLAVALSLVAVGVLSGTLVRHVVQIAPVLLAAAVSRGLQGLATCIARRLNRLMGRSGKVFAHRYHARALRTPTEVANALAYVLGNFAVHAARRGKPVPAHFVDSCTSLDMRVAPADPEVPLTAAPSTWLLRIGWQRAVP